MVRSLGSHLSPAVGAPAVMSQSLVGSVVFRQPWGSVNVIGGGSVQRIRDQLYLSAEGATEEEILLCCRALATNFQYFAHFGVSYTFDSRLSTIVPPFGGSGEDGISIVN